MAPAVITRRRELEIAPEDRQKRIRVCSAQYRSAPDEGPGSFEALVSAYDLTYQWGYGWLETIAQGCFAASLVEHPVQPIFYEHSWSMPGPVGDARGREETKPKPGLIEAGVLYVEDDPFVARLYRAALADALNEWSIAFVPTVIAVNPDNMMDETIVEAELLESSLCVRGCNPETETLDLRARHQQGLHPALAPKEDANRSRHFSVPDLGRLRDRNRPPRARTDDTDDDPAALAQALDAVIDEAIDALGEDDAAQALDLLTSAASTSDDLIEVLGGVDADEVAEPTAEPTADSATLERARQLVGEAKDGAVSVVELRAALGLPELQPAPAPAPPPEPDPAVVERAWELMKTPHGRDLLRQESAASRPAS